MANAELNIVLKLVDDATAGIRKSTEQLSKGFNDFGKSAKSLGSDIKSVGKELTRMGTTLTFVGGAISAFFVKSLNDGSKSSMIIQDHLDSLNSEFVRLQRTIGEAVLPVIDKITGYVDNFNQALDKIPRQLKEQILQGLLTSAVLLTLAGTITIVVGKFTELIGNTLKFVGSILSLNPAVLVTIAVIGSLIFLMFKFGDTTRSILNAMQSFFLALQQGFLKIKAGLENFVSSGLSNLSVLYDKLSGLPGPLKEFYQQAAISTLEASNNMQKFANEDLVNAEIAALKLKDIVSGQDGTWAQGFEGMRQKIQDVISWIEGLGSTAPAKLNLVTASMESLKTTTKSAGDVFQKGFGDAFAKMIVEGQNFSISLKSLFKDIAEMFIAEVGRMIAKWLAFTALKAVGKFFGFSGGSGGIQGFNQGSPGVAHLASGSDTIPAMLTPGEIVIPKSLSDSIRQGQLSLGGPASKGGSNGHGDVYLTINYPKMSNKEEVQALSGFLGQEILRQLRYARGA